MTSSDVHEKEEANVSSADDELTSLSWLQNSNLLFNTTLCPVRVMNVPQNGELPETRGTSTVEVVASSRPKVESPTSDFEEQDPMEQSENENDEHYNGLDQSTTTSYNPQIHIKSKPPYSFSSLIFMAIEDSTEKALPVKDIYAWVIHHFPYYKSAPTGWKNSVRHNLSLNKCFCKVDKSPTLGKGSLWMVDPAFRPNLLQTLSKTPYPVSPRSDHMYVSNTRYPDCRAPLDHLSRLKEGIFEYNREFEDRMKYEKQVHAKIEPYIHNEMYPHIPKDDVEAALAMVTLRQGRPLLPNAHMATVNVEPSDGSQRSRRKRKQCHNELVDPSVDHSYVSDLVGNENKRAKRDNSPVSVDEAFSEESFESEEEKSVANSALFNLASIATTLASQSHFVNNLETKDVPFSSFRRTEFCIKTSIHGDADRHI